MLVDFVLKYLHTMDNVDFILKKQGHISKDGTNLT